MKAILTSLAICAGAFGLCSCGDTSKSTSTSATSTTASAKVASTPTPTSSDRDNDGDSSGHGLYDSDDKSLLSFGHAADSSDSTQVSALVRRYYEAATAEDGATACSMLYSTYAEAVPEDFGTSPPGPSYARGTTCPAVMTAIFKHFHNQFVQRLPKLKVAVIRIKDLHATVILSFGALSPREMRAHREGSAWKLVSLIDDELP